MHEFVGAVVVSALVASSWPATEPGVVDPGGGTSGVSTDGGIFVVDGFGGGRSCRVWFLLLIVAFVHRRC